MMRPMMSGSSELSFAAGEGTTQLYALSHSDRLPVLTRVTNRTSNGSSVVSYSNDTLVLSSAFSFACSYTVYANVTALTCQWYGTHWELQPSAGDQLTLSTSHCGTFNAFRVALIVWPVAIALSTLVPYALFLYFIMRKPQPQRSQPSAAAPQGKPLSVASPTVPAAAAAVEPAPSPTREDPVCRALRLSRSFTVQVIGAVAYAVVGLVVFGALWAWVGAVDLPGAEADQFNGAWVAAYGAVVLISVVHTTWDYWRGSSELRRLKAEDGRVDASLFRISALLCGCPQRHRRGDGFELQEDIRLLFRLVVALATVTD